MRSLDDIHPSCMEIFKQSSESLYQNFRNKHRFQIPIKINGRQARAYEELKNAAGSDYITDVKIQESWTYAFLGTVYHTTLTATAYPAKNK